MENWKPRIVSGSLLQFHHFRIGTLESFVEKYPNDPNVIHSYKNVSDEYEPFGDDHGTLNPWVDWFIFKVLNESLLLIIAG
jgi:hypothetical protein